MRSRLFPKGIIPTTTATLHPLPGEYSAVEPPDPIPNSEVKRSCADGSVHAHARVGHRQGLYPKPPQRQRCGGFSLRNAMRSRRVALRPQVLCHKARPGHRIAVCNLRFRNASSRQKSGCGFTCPLVEPIEDADRGLSSWWRTLKRVCRARSAPRLLRNSDEARLLLVALVYPPRRADAHAGKNL